ncbi:MAG TPA: universal stress protein [Terracidiphilus sp.]|jgi:nucleotide-binding universal stress UspA family protein|nr:universal stress protein [Terracidiphilus sp.]
MLRADTSRWTHPVTILVATDLSDLERLIPHAFLQAQDTGARLLLLHVIPAATAMAVDAVGMPYYDPSAALEYSTATLERWRSLANQRNIPCDVLVREGHPAQQIASAVRQFRADRILLGTRSRNKLSKLFLGSVAEQVLRSVQLPVITVGPDAHLPEGGRGNQKVVLHATTLREASRPGAVLACRIAASQSAGLVLLHVLPTASEMTRLGEPTGLDFAAMHALRVLAESTNSSEGAQCPRIEPLIVHGNPSIEILATAADRKASLIVLGATDRSALNDLTRDRTIYRVLAHARCPVLTLREASIEASLHSQEQTALQS